MLSVFLNNYLTDFGIGLILAIETCCGVFNVGGENIGTAVLRVGRNMGPQIYGVWEL
jgi:hypothetical protein